MHVATRFRLAAAILRRDAAFRRGAKTMPKPAPWEWVRPRLLPLLAGPCLPTEPDEVVRAVAAPGCAVLIGVDLGGSFAYVDERVAERWETSTQQLLAAAMGNLARRASRVPQENVVTGTLSGYIVRTIRRPRWVSSLVLVPCELMRLFGSHDQLVAAPGRGLLVSFPADMPLSVAADTVVDLEIGDPEPLLLDPFVIDAGELIWRAAEDPP
jgi:hypothetical protein